MMTILILFFQALMSKRLEVRDTHHQSRSLDRRDTDARSETPPRKVRDTGAALPGRALRTAKMDEIDHEAEYAKFKLEEVYGIIILSNLFNHASFIWY